MSKRPREGPFEYVPPIGGPSEPILTVHPVKEKLRTGGIVVAGTICTPSVESAVVMASAFDVLWIEGEHSAVTLESTRNIILATRGMKAMPFVRVPWQEMWMAKRVMDIGALGVIFPFCSTVERAKQCANACRYPPLGCRGCGPTLAQLAWGLDEDHYYKWANENMMCIVIIEEAKAIQVVDEIASIPGIDLLFIGTSDLSFSITGDKRNAATPPVQDAIAKVLSAGRKYGIPVGCPAGTAEAMQQMVHQGFRFFQAPPEIGFLQRAVKEFSNSLTRLTDPGAPDRGGGSASTEEAIEAQVC